MKKLRRNLKPDYTDIQNEYIGKEVYLRHDTHGMDKGTELGKVVKFYIGYDEWLYCITDKGHQFRYSDLVTIKPISKQTVPINESIEDAAKQYAHKRKEVADAGLNDNVILHLERAFIAGYNERKRREFLRSITPKEKVTKQVTNVPIQAASINSYNLKALELEGVHSLIEFLKGMIDGDKP